MATSAPRVLQELPLKALGNVEGGAMAAVVDKDESTKEAISPEAWSVKLRSPIRADLTYFLYQWGYGDLVSAS